MREFLCGFQYQSYDPNVSCSSFTVPNRGTKCVPTKEKPICEQFLETMYKSQGAAAAVAAAVSQGCKCELIEWNSINGSIVYEINLLASSSSLYEGPLVVDDYLYWSSLSEGIMRRGPDGDISIIVEANEDFVPHGLGWDPTTETLIVASAENTGKGAVFRVEKDLSLTKLTDGTRLNNPNDVAVSSDGTIYFTDPYWRFQQKPITDAMGLYSIKDGEVFLEFDFAQLGRLAQPNGIVLSDNEKRLYVTLTGSSRVVSFNVKNNKQKNLRRRAQLFFDRFRGDDDDDNEKDKDKNNDKDKDKDKDKNNDKDKDKDKDKNNNNDKDKDKNNNDDKDKDDDIEIIYENPLSSLQYNGDLVESLSVNILPDGAVIYNDVLYVATNLDYIEMIPLKDNTAIQAIDLYDAGVSTTIITAAHLSL